MIDAVTFRGYFPEFADTVKYPDGAVNFWIGVATLMLPTQTWGIGSTTPTNPPTTPIDIGAALFVAHNLVLETKNAKVAAGGGIPGSGASGPVSSESVGGVSRSYDTSAGLNLDGGPWNLTTYGTRFLFMARLAGKGPVQIGVDPCGAVMPWFGPPVGPNGYW
jgi:hypothetical protein